MHLLRDTEIIDVAVKVFDCTNKRNFKIFSRELRVYCLCEDDFLLKFYGASMAGNTAMLVFELGTGGSFWDYLKLS